MQELEMYVIQQKIDGAGVAIFKISIPSAVANKKLHFLKWVQDMAQNNSFSDATDWEAI